jgi:two-component system chemotaxis response regulator CheB
MTFAQDEASCVVYGMPKAAVELGAAQKVAPLDKMAGLLREAVLAVKG